MIAIKVELETNIQVMGESEELNSVQCSVRDVSTCTQARQKEILGRNVFIHPSSVNKYHNKSNSLVPPKIVHQNAVRALSLVPVIQHVRGVEVAEVVHRDNTLPNPCFCVFHPRRLIKPSN